MVNYLYQFVICFLVSFFIGFSLKTNLKVSLFGGLAGGLGYLVYLLCPDARIGYFLSTIVITLCSEILARLCKIPANNFLILAVYPLVPGTALYQTAAYAVQGKYEQALQSGGDALVFIILMTIAIALVPTIFRILSGEPVISKRKPLNYSED